MNIQRWLRNLIATPFVTRRRFPAHALQAIEHAITTVEARHAGEIRFVIETSLDLPDLWAGRSPRERAIDVFSHLRVWDTEHNNGVLIYLLMAERDVEIIADRGISVRVSAAEWEQVCRQMEARFRDGQFKEGALAGIEAVAGLLALHFPSAPGDRNEQPNRPVLL
ncbi:MAG: hypothetical protein FGM43_07170 [Sinobacteraceae bacterium]|nr:hypothetical protein [Nevskiaceae bacterium]